MKNILTSKWFALGVGMVGFLVTMILLREPPQPEAPPEAGETEGSTNEEPAHVELEEHSPLQERPMPIVAPPRLVAPLSALEVGEPGSLQFNNPDVTELVAELKREKEELRKWEADLNELKQRLDLEKESISVITQEVLRAKAALELTLTAGLTLTDDTEQQQLRSLAGVYTNMPPASAAQILNGLESEDIARILVNMQPVEQAAILENFATNKILLNAEGKATEISERLRKLTRKPQISTRRGR